MRHTISQDLMETTTETLMAPKDSHLQPWPSKPQWKSISIETITISCSKS